MNESNVIILVLAVMLTAVVVGGGVYLWQQNENEIIETSSSQIQADNNSDVSQEESIEVEDTQPTVEAKDVMAGLLATKHSRDAAEANLTVEEDTGTHAKGLVIFDGDIGGGWWLAAKADDKWVLVADGNGTVMCSDIDPYNFPTTMVPECWDETTQTLITR